MGLLLMSVVIVGMGVPESMAGEDQVRVASLVLTLVKSGSAMSDLSSVPA